MQKFQQKFSKQAEGTVVLINFCGFLSELSNSSINIDFHKTTSFAKVFVGTKDHQSSWFQLISPILFSSSSSQEVFS
jgi:hypothetical protein